MQPRAGNKKQPYAPGEIEAYFAERVPGLNRQGSEWRGPCPIHGGEHNNFTVKPETGQFFCHSQCQAGGSLIQLEMKLSGEDFKTAAAEVDRIVGRPSPSYPKIVKTYDYVDENDSILFQVVRYKPKAFSQRRPDGHGGWIGTTKGVRRVLYRLPRLKDATTVISVEGEKDVESLEGLGFVATCNSGGAGKWQPDFADALVNKIVVVMPDNDEPGRKHAEQVIRTLRGKAREIRLVTIPKGKDASDWIAAGATAEVIAAAIAAARPLASEAAAVVEMPQAAGDQRKAYGEQAGDSSEDLPEIVVSNRQLRDLRADCIAALQAQNNEAPQLFTRGDSLVDLRKKNTGGHAIVDLTDVQLRGLLAGAASFYVQRAKELKNCSPPIDAARDILALRQLGDLFPELAGITEIPVLRPDGTVLDQPGYDQDTRLYYIPALGLSIPEIPAHPGREAIERSLRLIDSAFGDFPFVEDLNAQLEFVPADCHDPGLAKHSASRANALAAALTPLVRPMVDGPTPLALIDAPAPGTGKTLLTEVISIIATGRPAPLFSAPREEEEWRKQITAHLCDGISMIVIDNVRDRLESAQLSKALTASVWSDRILGHSTTVQLPVRCTWLATGNNISVGGDLPRRCYWIRLDAQTSAPHLRHDFLHPNLRAWTAENRGDLIAALLTLARAWFADSKPPGKQIVLGSYESWAETITGILGHAGVEGFMANAVELRERTEVESGQATALLLALYEATKGNQFTSSEIYELLIRQGYRPSMMDLLPPEVAEALNQGGIFQRRFGKWCAERADRRFGESEVYLKRAGFRHKVQLWQIVNPGAVRSMRESGGSDPKTGGSSVIPRSTNVAIACTDSGGQGGHFLT